jgi:ribosome-associated protein
MTKPSTSPTFPPKPSKAATKKQALVFELNGQEFIELNKLLKLLGLAESGGEAGMSIVAGEVKVNNAVVNEKRKKVRSGFKIEFRDAVVTII